VFVDHIIYFATISGSSIQQVSLDGTAQRTLYTDTSGNYRGLALYLNNLYIADSTTRYTIFLFSNCYLRLNSCSNRQYTKKNHCCTGVVVTVSVCLAIRLGWTYSPALCLRAKHPNNLTFVVTMCWPQCIHYSRRFAIINNHYKSAINHLYFTL